jgi:hypothetical protein
MIRTISSFALALAACSPEAGTGPEAPPALAAELAAPANLKALEVAHDWQYGDGAKLNADWNAGVKAVLGKMSRPDAIGAITGAGFDCIYGEAHEDYPDPMAVCSRSFATRDCQMGWEIASTADKGRVNEVDGMFTRDCVGIDRDWPDPIRSAIDDQLGPTPPPTARN